MSDRTVATDAVATLGMTIDIKAQRRDAIHLATEPVVAGEKLFPGQDIGLTNGVAVGNPAKRVGIVDPFLKNPVMPGEAFWLIVYPRTITSLQHSWTHPDFDETAVVTEAPVVMSESEKYLRSFADTCKVSYETLLLSCKDDEGTEDLYLLDGNYAYPNEEFWEHYKNVTGREFSTWASYIDDGCRGC